MFDLDLTDGIARLRLNRPDARNAISVADWIELARCIEQVAGLDARLLLLLGGTEAFCAGADLGEFERLNQEPELRPLFRQGMRAAIDGIWGLTIPSIAVVEGGCYGAGVALALACDLRVAGEGAHFAITPAKLGIGYPQEDVHRLVGLVGPGQAARLLLTAERIDAAEAHRIGLVELVASNAAEEAERLASRIPKAGASLAVLKAGIRLAARGVRHDEDQDRQFDALLGAEELPDRLSSVRSPS